MYLLFYFLWQILPGITYISLTIERIFQVQENLKFIIQTLNKKVKKKNLSKEIRLILIIILSHIKVENLKL